MKCCASLLKKAILFYSGIFTFPVVLFLFPIFTIYKTIAFQPGLFSFVVGSWQEDLVTYISVTAQQCCALGPKQPEQFDSFSDVSLLVYKFLCISELDKVALLVADPPRCNSIIR